MASQAELDAVRRAVVLSQAALGATSPNPPVGAVVLDAAGAVVGEGWTSRPGGPHAEVVALQAAGDSHREEDEEGQLCLCGHAQPRCNCLENFSKVSALVNFPY